MSFQELHTIDLNTALGKVNMSFKSITGLVVCRSKVLITTREQRPQGQFSRQRTQFFPVQADIIFLTDL